MRRTVTRGVLSLAVLPAFCNTQSALALGDCGPHKLTASDAAIEDFFGSEVAISGDTAVVSAPFKDRAGGPANDGAVYVYRWTGAGWAEEQVLIPPLAADSHRFGDSIDIDGDTLIVGAPFADGAAAVDQGLAYVYTRSGTTWTLQQTLSASDATSSDRFGGGVAVSGDTVIVGAQVAGALQEGGAYVYVRSAGVWTEEAILKAPDGTGITFFGIEVDVSGDSAVVGAPSAGNPGAAQSGAAYAFSRSGTTWTFKKKFTSAAPVMFDAFGAHVSMDGDTAAISTREPGPGLVVGRVYVFHLDGDAWLEEANIVPEALYDGAGNFAQDVAIDGDTLLVGSSGEPRGGDVFVFERSGGVWSQTARINRPVTPSDPFPGAPNFGGAVGIDGDFAIIGAPTDDPASEFRGAAWAYERAGGAWVEIEQKLWASTPISGAEFGWATAIDGDTLVVGARAEDTLSEVLVGAAYVFVREGNLWVEQAKLTASDGDQNDTFGESVAIDGDTILVGANNADSVQGAVYVYQRFGDTWFEMTKLQADDGTPNDQFGVSVALENGTAVIGASREFIGGFSGVGAAYVFVGSGAAWTQQQKLTGSAGDFDDWFGTSVDISGDTIIVGAPRDEPIDTRSGSAYIFTRSGTTWTEQQYLVPSSGAAIDQFGEEVAVDGDTALVGVPGQGAAYIFDRVGATWSETTTLTPTTGGGFFGLSLDLQGDRAVIGQRDFTGPVLLQGSAYIFTRFGSAWIEHAQLLANDADVTDAFGIDVALSGDTVLVGVRRDDFPSGGPLENQHGSAWVFYAPDECLPPLTRVAESGILYIDIPSAIAAAKIGETIIFTPPAVPIVPLIDTSGKGLTLESTGGIKVPSTNTIIVDDDSVLRTTLQDTIDNFGCYFNVIAVNPVITQTLTINNFRKWDVRSSVLGTGPFVTDVVNHASGVMTIQGQVQVTGGFVNYGSVGVLPDTELTVEGGFVTYGSVESVEDENNRADGRADHREAVFFGPARMYSQATFRLPTTTTATVSVASDLDIAISDGARFDMRNAELHFIGDNVTQTMEMMSTDIGADSAGIEELGAPGRFPIGAIVVGPDVTLASIDKHDNDRSGQQTPEVAYVAAVSLDPTADVDQNLGTIYAYDFSPSSAFSASFVVICAADLDGDQMISGADLAILLTQWGANGGPADLTGDGSVDGADLAILLAAWGPC